MEKPKWEQGQCPYVDSLDPCPVPISHPGNNPSWSNIGEGPCSMIMHGSTRVSTGHLELSQHYKMVSQCWCHCLNMAKTEKNQGIFLLQSVSIGLKIDNLHSAHPGDGANKSSEWNFITSSWAWCPAQLDTPPACLVKESVLTLCFSPWCTVPPCACGQLFTQGTCIHFRKWKLEGKVWLD